MKRKKGTVGYVHETGAFGTDESLDVEVDVEWGL